MVEVLTLDFNVDEAAEGEMPPDGTYHFQVSKVEFGISGSGNKKIVLEADIVDDPLWNGRRIFEHLALTQAAAFKIRDVGKALGVDYQRINLNDWQGKLFYADTVVEDYEGRKQLKIKKYRQQAV